MSDKCINITPDVLNDLNKEIRFLIRDAKRFDKTSELRSTIAAKLLYIGLNYDVMNNPSVVTEIVQRYAKKFGVYDLSPNWFSDRNLGNILIRAAQKILNNNPLDTSTEQLTNTEEVHRRYEASLIFMDKAYGHARDLRTYVTDQTNSDIFDVFFISRTLRNGRKVGVTRNSAELNNNIRKYQLVLFDRIIAYIKPIYDRTDKRTLDKTGSKYSLDKVKKAIEDPTLFKQVDGEMQYTGILEDLKGYIDSYLTYENSDALIQEYNKVKKNDEISKLRLDAYNAYIILSHFDSYLSQVLGKAIQINGGFNALSGKDKYQIAGKVSNVYGTWRTDENIVVEKEIDEITKLAINTTPLYTRGGTPIEGKFLHFLDFSHIIAKIKDLGRSQAAKNILINEQSPFWNGLAKEAKFFLKEKTLSEAINHIRRNPRVALDAIFQVLTNNTFFDTYESTIFEGFTEGELTRLWSMSKGIFNSQYTDSISFLTGEDTQNDYYTYLCQVADSIFNIQYVQYYKDENGITRVRTLMDLSINNIVRQLEDTINVVNSRRLIKDYNDIISRLNIKVDNELKPKTFEFDIPIANHKLHVRLYTSSGLTEYTDNGKAFNMFDLLWDELSVKDYIDSVFRIGFADDVDLQNALLETLTDKSKATRNLLDFVVRTTFNQYVSNKILKGVDADGVQAKLKGMFLEKGSEYNYDLDEFGLVHSSDINTLKKIGLAKANLYGLTTAAQVKDGSGNGQSLQSLSRLLGSNFSQQDLLENQADSVTRNSILFRIPDLFEGVFTAKEFYDMTESTDSTEMNTSELSYSGIIYDFIGGLMEADADSFIGNGHVLFLPSVNSDKGTIGRIKVNLNTQVIITPNGEYIFVNTGEGKAELMYSADTNTPITVKHLKDFTTLEILGLIALQFGQYYSLILDKFINDFNILLEDINYRLLFDGKNITIPAGYLSSYLTNFVEFNNWFYQNKEVLKEYGETPVEFVKYFTQKYNEQHRLNPIELVDLGHFINKKGNLASNETLISQIARFNPGKLSSLNALFNFNDYATSEQFWNIKNRNIIESLIKSKFRVNTTNTQLPELKWFKENYSVKKDSDGKIIDPGWINASGDMIIARLTIGENTYNISSLSDLVKAALENGIIKNDDLFKAATIELNPIIEKYNLFDYLFTQEWMNNSVGSFVFHPDKSENRSEAEIKTYGEESAMDRVLRREASRFLSQHKRNVSFTAAMHAFLLNSLNGIPEDYNIVVIEDIIDFQSSIYGQTSRIKPFDGATFVNPFIVLLENFSLGGAKAGITKKQFVHFKNHRTGNGGIIKTAGFGLTNDLIRNSKLMQIMMQKMTDRTWIDLNGNNALYDIFTGFKGAIEYDDIYFKNDRFGFQVVEVRDLGNGVYERDILRTIDGQTESRFTETKTLTKPNEILNFINGEDLKETAITVEIEAVEGQPGYFKRILYPVKMDGTMLGELYNGEEAQLINSNYKLWKFFGGDLSMSLVNGKLEWSNTSVENVVKAMNNIGVILTQGQRLLSQDQVFQPLKHSDVHYVATEGAVKQGAANINSASKYTNNLAYDILRIKMYQAGILLDKEHHADDADLSLMTLVVSACAAKGYTLEAAIGLYNALKQATKIGTKEHLDALYEVFKNGDRSTLQEVLIQSIIKGLESTNTDNFIAAISSELMEKAREGIEIKYNELNFPLSDNTIRNKVISLVTSYLTKTGIKQTIPGILSILSPSYDLFKVWNGRKLESYNNFDLEIKEAQALLAPVFDVQDPTTNISDIELDRNYFITRLVSPTVLELQNFFYGNLDYQTTLEGAYRAIIKNRLRQVVDPSLSGILDANVSVELLVNRLVNDSFLEDKELVRTTIIKEVTRPFNLLEQEILNNIFHDLIFTNPELMSAIMSTDLQTLQSVVGKYGINISNFDYTKDQINLFAQTNEIQLSARVETVSELIRTPKDYKQLKNDIKNGKVFKVVENLREGRNLAAYNVRYTSESGERFLLWDLDSAIALFDIVEAYKKASPEQKLLFKRQEILLRRLLQRDLMNLSKSTPDLMLQYDALLETNDGTQEWHDKYAMWVNIYLGTGNGSKIELDTKLALFTLETPISERGSLFLNHSGGADGSDSYWGDLGARYGITSNHYFDELGHIENPKAKMPPKANKPITELDRIEGARKVAQAAKTMYGYSYETMKDPRLIRNWSLVKYADSIFAIGTLIEAGTPISNRSNETRKALTRQVAGGTGYAVQMAINEGKPVYLFDLNQNKWFTYKNGEWIETDTPILTQHFAGIGTRGLNANGQRAIQEVYRKTFEEQASYVTDKLLSVTSKNFEFIQQLVRNQLFQSTFVYINNKPVKVDRNSVKTLPYEIIMPKTFATKFGLDTFADLNTIANDPDYFIKLYLRNNATKLEENLFTIELKKSDGKHYYLLTKAEALKSTNLEKVSKDLIETLMIDGKELRLYPTDHRTMYDITEDFELYRDKSTGEEVIVTDDLGFYIENLHFDSINLSNNINLKLVPKVLSILSESTKDEITYFYNYVTRHGRDSRPNKVLEANNSFRTWLTEDNYKINGFGLSGRPTNPITIAGRNKHTSFLKSLEIIASRTPSQSMQSFMPMKVIAFDNPDINTAYVSTMLILLQGSDYDIDAVSLATYDINDNGILKLWSPYANSTTLLLMNGSMRIPIPTGQELNYKTIDSFVPFAKFLSKYADLLGLEIPVDRKVDGTETVSPDKVNININLDSSEKIDKFIQFLKDVENLEIPSEGYYEKLVEGLNLTTAFNRPITLNHLQSLFDGIKKAVDKHNLYFEKVSVYNLLKIINNHTLYSMFEIINDPVNLIQAHTSVDSTTGPLKEIGDASEEGYLVGFRTPGNVFNKFESIVENQVGKKGIGICATGLKSFFGATQYANYLLNYGIAEDLERILLGKINEETGKHEGITINGKTYKTLANIRSKDPNTIKNLEVLRALASVNNDEDAALILSALLSLATDNAKELQLSKLNAGTKTLGLYVYGISIGMNFEEIANIMMSPVGLVINEVLNGNIYSGRRGFGSLDKRVFEYFEKTPIEYLKDINIISGYDVKITPLETFIEKFNKKIPNIVNNLKIPKKILNSTIKARNQFIFERVFAKYITNPEISYQDKVNLINEISYKTSNLTNQEVFNQIKDFILDYTRQVDTVIRNIDTFNDIRTLSEGAAEMRTLGQLLGINQGIKTKADEFIKQVLIIERAIYDKTKDPNDIINLTRFVIDENPYTDENGVTWKNYREFCIDKYEKLAKHSFNILDIVSTVPHFLEYVTNLAEANEELNSSFIFRSTKAMSLTISDRLKYNREDKIIKGIANFLNDYLIKLWMSRTNQLKPIAIPKGNKIFDKNGVESELKEPTTIKLGTDEANATFRAWFENEVIPNLKRGEIRLGIHNEEVENNKFIKDIGNSVVNNTILRNPSIVESLPISMSPRSENERSVFDNYRSAFNEIGGLVYEWNTYTYEFEEDGAVKAIPESHKMSIVDLFTLYSMVANSWKSGERSIVPILVDFLRVGLIQDFHDFVGKVDKSEDVLTLEDIEFNDILPYVAPSESPYSSFAEYIRYRNKDSHKYQLMQRIDEDAAEERYEELRKTGMTEEEIEEQIKLDRKNRKGKFEFININVDPNYFLTGRVQSSNAKLVRTTLDEITSVYLDESIEGSLNIKKLDENTGSLDFTYETHPFNIEFDIKTGKITKSTFPLKQVTHAPIIKEEGKKKIDLANLYYQIMNELNPC